MATSLATVLKGLNLTLQQIGSSALDQPIYQDWGEEGYGFFKFINEWMKAYPDVTRKDAAVAYRLTKFWSSQMDYVNKLPTAIMTPWQMAEVVEKNEIQWGTEKLFRYDVAIKIDFGQGDEPRVFTRYIYRSSAADFQDIYDEAVRELMERWKPGSKTPDQGGDNKIMQVSFSLDRFIRYSLVN